MNLLILTKFIFLFAHATIPPTSIYDLSISTINGVGKGMNEFQGKKLLIIVIPSSSDAGAVSYMKAIDSIAGAYSDSLNIVCVPAFEYGFSARISGTLQSFYTNFTKANVIISQGMNTSKASGSSQSILFNWLSDPTKNGHFSQDVRGIGQKYFVSSQGELFGVYGPEMSLSKALMEFMINGDSNLFFNSNK